MKRLLGAAFSLLLFMSCPALAESQGTDSDAPEIIYIDTLIVSEPIQMPGKRLQFKLREGQPAPLPCTEAYCSKDGAAKVPNLIIQATPEPAQGEADE